MSDRQEQWVEARFEQGQMSEHEYLMAIDVRYKDAFYEAGYRAGCHLVQPFAAQRAAWAEFEKSWVESSR